MNAAVTLGVGYDNAQKRRSPSEKRGKRPNRVRNASPSVDEMQINSNGANLNLIEVLRSSGPFFQ